MSANLRTACLVCGRQPLQLLLDLSAEGTPHGEAGHNFMYSRATVAVCGQCGHGQLEKYDHDCFSYDEDWNMYWWYALSPAEVARLRAALNNCPEPLNPECRCAVHQDLRESGEHLWGGVKHAFSPHGSARYAWLQVVASGDHMALIVDAQKGTGAAA